MVQNIFQGLGIALVTPFTAAGAVDYDCLRRLVDYQLAQGATFLCILCTTSETPCLTEEEKEQIRATVVATAAGRVPIVMGVGGNNTAALVAELATRNFSGIDGILSVCPYYNKPTQEGLYQHFTALARATPLPLILYNVPGRTGVNLRAQTALRLARDNENIVAIKEASGQLPQAEELLAHKPPHFAVLCGDDALTCEMVTRGAAGAISVVANALPQRVAQMVAHARQGDYAAAKAIDSTLREMYRLLFADGNPAGVKALLAEMGLAENRLRLPLVPVSAATRQGIVSILKQLDI